MNKKIIKQMINGMEIRQDEISKEIDRLETQIRVLLEVLKDGNS